MHDVHLPAIATVGGLVLGCARFLFGVLRKQREADDKKFEMLVTKLDAMIEVVSKHVVTDAAQFAVHQTQLVSHEKRLDRLDDVA